MEIIDKLEQIADQTDLGTVLSALSQICFLKAEHIQVNRQDAVGSRYWIRMGAKLDLLSGKA